MTSLQKVTQANLKLLFVSDPRVAKIFNTRAAGQKKKKFGFLTVPWAYVICKYICYALLDFLSRRFTVSKQANIKR